MFNATSPEKYTTMSTTETQIVPNSVLEPWFDSHEKQALNRLANFTVDASVEAINPQIDLINGRLNALTVDPVPFRFVATNGQTVFTINGVIATEGELVLVHRNGLYLHPINDYTTSFSTDPETTTITLASAATAGDIVAGFVYNLTVVSTTGGGGATTLDGLDDVIILNPQIGQSIRWNGTRWVNVTDSGDIVPTNLGNTPDADSVTITSSTGLSTDIVGATGSNAGVMVAADKIKLNGIQAGATQNATDAALRDRSTHTGTQAPSTISMITAGLLGRSTAGTGGAEEIQIGTNLTLTAGVLSASGGGTPDFVIQSFGVI